MGTTLSGTTPQSTYPSLIKVGDNSALSATLKTLSDGAGNDLPMQVSTSIVNFTGDVGIGTTSPTSKLHVAGSVLVQYSGSSDGYLQVGSNGGGIIFSSANRTDVSLKNNAIMTTRGTGVTFRTTSGEPNGAVVGVVGSGSTSATTSLLVQNSGGTAAVTVKDDLTTTFGGDCTINNSNVVTLKLNDTLNSKILTFYKNSGSNYIIDSNSDTRLAYGWGGNYFWKLNGATKSMAMSSTTSDPNADNSAIVDFQSTTKGFLPPRMTTIEKNAIATPAAGLMVYDTTLARPCFYNGAAWITL